MKKFISLSICLLLIAITIIYIGSEKNVSASTSIITKDGEIVAYAAAFATLDYNDGKSKNEMLLYSRDYLSKKTDVLLQISDYLKKNSVSLSNADYVYCETLYSMNKNNLTKSEYETLIPLEIRLIIEERNDFLEKMDMELYELDKEYDVDKLPVLYYSIDELKMGIEESLNILNDYDHMMDGKSEPDMDGYTINDFYRLLNERIDIEQAILDDLNNDPKPDLYSYCLKLYNAREDHPVIY